MAELPRVIDPLVKTSAVRAKRLIDFETGGAEPRSEHKDWLDETLRSIPKTDEFFFDIIGFASKLNKKGLTKEDDIHMANSQLSSQRAWKIADYLIARDLKVQTRCRRLEGEGDRAYSAGAKDDSALFRAVEVHLYINSIPPPPPGVKEIDGPPLPHGRRYRKWKIATPGGVTYSPVPGIVLAANVLVFKPDEPPYPAPRGYLSPALGFGISWSGPKTWGFVKSILGTPNYSGMSWTDAKADTPFNYYDLHGASSLIVSANVGIGVAGYVAGTLSVSGKVWVRESTGKAMHKSGPFVTNVNISGPNMNFGVGGAPVGGVLIELSD